MNQSARNIDSEFNTWILVGNLWLVEVWLGGLDSNQDNQIQNLMYCQLYDLPTAAQQDTRQQKRIAHATLKEF
jgi:hypothetical protein